MARLHLPRNGGVIVTASNAFADVWNIFFSGLANRADAAAAVAPVSVADAAAAPAAYSQSHVQTIVDELNSTKAQLNALISALNT